MKIKTMNEKYHGYRVLFQTINEVLCSFFVDLNLRKMQCSECLFIKDRQNLIEKSVENETYCIILQNICQV